jgi:propionyl-CoA carboxylase alpha chain
MIAKLVVHGKDRTDAIQKMLRAINDYKIVGVETTLDFCTYVLKHEAFVSGKFDTGFIKNYFTPEVLQNNTNEFDEAIAIATHYVFENQKKQTVVNNGEAVKKSKWRENRI